MQDYSGITPEMARAEIARRQQASAPDMSQITPEMAREEIARREQSMARLPQDDKEGSGVESAYSWPVQAGKHALAAFGQAGHSLLNIPNKLTGGKVPAYEPGYDYYEALGVKKNDADTLLQGGIEFAPYLWGAGAAMRGAGVLGKGGKAVAEYLAKNPWKASVLQNIGAGAAYGGVEAEPGKTGEGAAWGAGLGAAGSLVGGAVEQGIIKPAIKSYAESSIPALIKRATKMVKGGKAPEEGAAVLKGAYDQQAAINKRAWTDTAKMAEDLDNGLKGVRQVEKPTAILDKSGKPLTQTVEEEYSKFDNSPYKKFITNYLRDNKKRTPAQKESYKEAAAFGRYAKKLAPQNFKDAVNLRQNFNEHLDKFLRARNLEKADKHTKAFVKDLKDNLIKETVPANAKNVNPQTLKIFQDTWENANKSHQGLMQFHEGVAKAGNIKAKETLRAGLQQRETPDAAILSEYLPKAHQTGITGFQQLEKAVGSKQKAQEILKSFYLRKPLEQGASSPDISTIYSKLSPQQREYIFGGSKEKDLLRAVNEARLAFQPKSKKAAVLHHGLTFGGPGLLAFGAGKLSGMDWDDALMLGVGTGLGAKGMSTLAGKLATPKSVLRALGRYEKGGQHQGKFLNTLLQQIGASGDQS